MTAETSPVELDSALADRKVVVLFHASWCGFCRAFAPIFRRLAPLTGTYQPHEVLIDDDEDPLWTRYRIEAVPTVIFFDSGQVVARVDSRLGVGISEGLLRQALEGAP